MKVKETIDRAYGNVPKEVGLSFSVDFGRGFKYYYLKLIRWIR